MTAISAPIQPARSFRATTPTPLRDRTATTHTGVRDQPSLWFSQPITPGKGSLAPLACAPAVRAVARAAFASV